MRQIVADAEKVDALWYQLYEIDADDELAHYLVDRETANDQGHIEHDTLIYVGRKFPAKDVGEALVEKTARRDVGRIIIDAFSDDFIVAEATFRLATYYRDGHINNEMLSGQDTPEAKREAQQEVRQLKKFLRKYDN